MVLYNETVTPTIDQTDSKYDFLLGIQKGIACTLAGVLCS